MVKQDNDGTETHNRNEDVFMFETGGRRYGKSTLASKHLASITDKLTKTGRLPIKMRNYGYVCDFCKKTPDYMDSYGTIYCGQCWYHALQRNVRSIKKKPALWGPKHWVSSTLYHRLLPTFVSCGKHYTQPCAGEFEESRTARKLEILTRSNLK